VNESDTFIKEKWKSRRTKNYGWAAKRRKENNLID
jgi:hypothetical protein